MSQTDRSVRSGGSEQAASSLLRAKFLDYCSARVAEALLALTPDEMYLLALDVARGSGVPDSSPPSSYDEIVRLATERITKRVELPTFEVFATAYAQDPERVEAELLGLWRSESEELGSRSTGL